MGGLISDLRFGLRTLARTRALSLAAIATTALGVGALSAIFSVVNGVLLRPLPYPDPDRLLLIWENFSQKGLSRIAVSGPEYLDYRDRSRVLQSVAAYRYQAYNLTGEEAPERYLGATASPSLFPLLGARPTLGRVFLSEEEQPGRGQVALLSHGLWQRRFSSDPHVIGRALSLNGEDTTVVGVLPEGFAFPSGAEIWMPLVLEGETLLHRQARSLRVIARLKEGSTFKEAQGDLDDLARRLQQDYPEVYPKQSGWSVTIVSLHEQIVGDARAGLLVLLGAVGCLLLVACANVANLLLARGASRQREMAVRSALGASGFRLVRQLLTESVLLALLGGSLGLLLALWGVDGLLSLNPDAIPRTEEIGIDTRVLGFTLLVSVLTGIAFGLAPARAALRGDLGLALKAGESRILGRYRVTSLLVVAEVAISLVLLSGAGLLMHSFFRLRAVNPGFRADNVLTMWIALPKATYDSQQKVSTFYVELLERIEALPGVESVGLIAGLPMGGSTSSWGFTTEAQPRPTPEEILEANFRMVSPGYFGVMGIPLIRGRAFIDQDDERAPGVVIVNETMARRFWPGQDPIGKRIRLGSPEPERTWDGLWLSIVGVSGDVRDEALDLAPSPAFYVPYLQNPWRGMPEAPYMTVVGRTMALAVQAAVDAGQVVASIRREVSAIDPNQPLTNVRPMADLISDSVVAPRFRSFLLGLFAATALVLAAVGIYGVMACSVNERTREIGIRLALGAERSRMLRLVLGQGLRLTLLGSAAGASGAFALSGVLASLLFEVSPGDPVTFLAVILVQGAASLLACYLPARRATRVDPVRALRCE